MEKGLNKKTGKRKMNSRGKKLIITITVIIVLIIAAFIAIDFIVLEQNDKLNLVINNNNITANLKNEIIIEEGTIYLSMDDVKNFFDKYIYVEDEIGMVVTTYEKKIAEIGFKENVITINGSDKKTYAHARKADNGAIYLPISEMKDVYGIEIEKHDDSKIITMDSTDRKQVQYTVKSGAAIKKTTDFISMTVDRVSSGEAVIKVSDPKDGWTKVRTNRGKIGYIKTDNLANELVIREDFGEEKQVEGKVNMFWDYYSKYKKAPDRSGTKVDGVNVVSPSFFYIDENGNLQENIGTEGKEYIEWAHNNGYKVWPMVSNAGDGMLTVTSTIMNSYKNRRTLCEQLTEACVKYNLDGINIDFENMKQEDKDLFSRFIIELTPRIKEVGDVISVDVTAPDGGETWSMCFDRNVIGHVASYIVFMAYDEYGNSSTKAGTTAGYNWMTLSLEKFLKTEEINPDKIILGLAVYTRLWTEGEDGKATSKIVSMKDIEETIPNGVEKKWDDDLKQYYVEYQKNGATMKMWIEDEKSFTEKLNIVTKNNLAGVAIWQKGMEPDYLWGLIKEKLNI